MNDRKENSRKICLQHANEKIELKMILARSIYISYLFSRMLIESNKIMKFMRQPWKQGHITVRVTPSGYYFNWGFVFEQNLTTSGFVV